MASINPEALYNACVSGDAAAVGRLLPAGTPLNLSGPRFQLRSHKRTPLIAAAARGHTDIVRMILERAPNTTVDYATVVGFTALLLSAQYHHVDILRKLADRGANVHLTTRGGNTALCFAVAPICHDDRLRDPDPDGSRQVAVVKALFRLGATADFVDSNGTTPLCVACDHDLPTQVIGALLDGDADLDFATPAGNYNGFTPLMYAASVSNAGVVKFLLKRGADGTKHTAQAFQELPAGFTALDIARLCADSDPDYVDTRTFTVLRKTCCSTCGITSPGLAAKTAGEKKHLKRCGNCPARGSRARYCRVECQRVDWVSRHRGECAEARRTPEAARTAV